MLKARFGSGLDRYVLRACPWLVQLRVRPDTLTTLGCVVSLLAALAFAYGAWRWAGALMLLAGWFDLVDGVVARAQGSASASGAFYDAWMDRLSDLLVLSGIAVDRARDADVAGTALVCAALIGTVMTSYTRALAGKHLVDLSAGWMERAERWLVLTFGALTGWMTFALAVAALGAGLTSLQRLIVSRRRLRDLTERPRAESAAPPRDHRSAAP